MPDPMRTSFVKYVTLIVRTGVDRHVPHQSANENGAMEKAVRLTFLLPISTQSIGLQSPLFAPAEKLIASAVTAV